MSTKHTAIALSPFTLAVARSMASLAHARTTSKELGITELGDLEYLLENTCEVAARSGHCPVAAALCKVGVVSDAVSQLTRAASPEAERGRLLRLAEYVMRQFLPRYLQRKFSARSGQSRLGPAHPLCAHYSHLLTRVPMMDHRATLPSARAAVAEMVAFCRQDLDELPSHRERQPYIQVGGLFVFALTTLHSLGMPVADPGCVMPRLIWLMRDGWDLIDTRELEQLLVTQ